VTAHAGNEPFAATQLPYRWATFLAYLTLFSRLLIPPVEFAMAIKGKDRLYAGIVAMAWALGKTGYGVVVILITMLISVLQSLFTETDAQRIAGVSVVVLPVIVNIVCFRKRWQFLAGVRPAFPVPPSPT
jgi:glycopeptide antibiotics resistance protein